MEKVVGGGYGGGVDVGGRKKKKQLMRTKRGRVWLR
jgi:hypothetical protein